MIKRLIKAMLLLVGGLILALIAMFVGANIWVQSEEAKSGEPSWLKLDDRFGLPSGYKVVGNGHWIERATGPSISVEDTSPESAATDLNLGHLDLSLHALLGKRISTHWLYCARSKIADAWIVTPAAFDQVTPLQLEQFLNAHERCLTEAGKRMADADMGSPRRYATRSMRVEMKQILKSSRGSQTIDAPTRQCLRENRGQEAFTQCMRKQTDESADALWREWGELVELMNKVRGVESKEISRASNEALQVGAGFSFVGQTTGPIQTPECSAATPASGARQSNCMPPPLPVRPTVPRAKAPTQTQIEWNKRWVEFEQGFEALVGVRPGFYTLLCAREDVEDGWIEQPNAMNHITKPQVDQLMESYRQCETKRRNEAPVLRGGVQHQFVVKAMRREMAKVYAARNEDPAIGSGVRTCLKTRNDRDDFMACMADEMPSATQDAIWAEWVGVFDWMTSLRKSIPARKPDAAAHPLTSNSLGTSSRPTPGAYAK